MRFGTEHGTVRENAGVLFAWPYPVDQVIVVASGRAKSLSSSSFLYQENKLKDVSAFLKPGVDGYLLTSDGNVIHCQSTLKYQVEDVSDFLFSVEEGKMDSFLRSFMDNAILRATAVLTLNDVLNKKALIADSKLILQKSLDDMEATLRSIKEVNPDDVMVNIKVSLKARHHKLVDLLDLLSKVGLKNFNLHSLKGPVSN